MSVEVIRRHPFGGTMMLVVRQPDDTLAQIPAWMFAPESAAMAVRDCPRVALGALRDLHSILDTVLPSTSHTDEGDGHGTAAGLLEPAELGPALSAAMRAALVPMLARLVLEAAEAGAEEVGDPVGKEADDEPNRT